MPSSLETNVRVSLEDRGYTLEELFEKHQTVKDTYEAVRRLTGFELSERSVRRWLAK